MPEKRLVVLAKIEPGMDRETYIAELGKAFAEAFKAAADEPEPD